MDILSTFERIPAEIRIIIYNLLLDDGGRSTIEIRNRDALEHQRRQPVCRSSYNIIEHTLYRRSRATTYCTTSDLNMYTSIMRANRKIYEETRHILYSTHTFSFEQDLEAIVPFLEDVRPETRPFLKEISLAKRGFVFSRDYDRCVWSDVCRFLAMEMQLGGLYLVVEGGLPRGGFPSVSQTFSATDFAVLKKARHEPLEWVWELLAIKGLRKLAVSAEMHEAPLHHSQAMTFFAEFSASIETGFTEFLKVELITN